LLPQYDTRIRYFRWRSVLNGLIDKDVAFYSDQALFTGSGYVNSQNNRYWGTNVLHVPHGMSLQDIIFMVWCAISARRTVRPVIFHEIRNFYAR
jgi:hypothetical protein